MLFRKLGGKFHFFLRFCTRKRSKTYLFISCYFRYANDVSVGDELLVQGNEKLIPTKVVDITDLIMQGNYSHYFYNFEFVGKY